MPSPRLPGIQWSRLALPVFDWCYSNDWDCLIHPIDPFTSCPPPSRPPLPRGLYAPPPLRRPRRSHLRVRCKSPAAASHPGHRDVPVPRLLLVGHHRSRCRLLRSLERRPALSTHHHIRPVHLPQLPYRVSRARYRFQSLRAVNRTGSNEGTGVKPAPSLLPPFSQVRSASGGILAAGSRMAPPHLSDLPKHAE